MVRPWSPTRRDQTSLARLAPSLRTLQSDIDDGNQYLEREHITGEKWIDGRAIYRKVLDVAPLPNATTRSITHNIDRYNNIVKIYGFAVLTDSNPYTHITLPYTSVSATGGIVVSVKGDDLFIDTGSIDYSVATEAYIVLEYTK